MGARLRPDFFVPIRLPDDTPRLFVVVDTEEEFDWGAPFSRDAVDVSAIAEVSRLQEVAARYRITPTYVVDYPVATTASSAALLRDLAGRGHCDVGAHLHPWVNPPYDEVLSTHASYACNLGLELEQAKILRLKEAIQEHLDVTPRVYKAGRYGFGPTTAEALESLAFDVDASVNPHMVFSADGGPSFAGFAATPSSFGHRRRLIELPCTTGFIGAARRLGSPLHRSASARWSKPFRAVGLLRRAGLLDKVRLSPEASTFHEMRSLTESLHRDGVRTFSVTLHSTSLRPGCTPYVQTERQRDAMLDAFDRYCDWFIGELGGVPSTPAALFDRVRAAESAAVP